MRIDKHGYKIYDKDEIISLVQNWYKKNGKIVIRDLRYKNGLPSTAQVINIFGSFQCCLKEAGIPIENKEHLFKRKELSDEDMIKRYKRFVAEHLKNHMFLPTGRQIDECKFIPSYSSYLIHFGSLKKLNELIGYNQKEFNLKALEKDMLFKYKRACEDFGYTLGSRDINKIRKENKDYIYPTSCYLDHFGSIHNLQEICKVAKTIPGKGMNKDELILKLQELGMRIGRVPVQKDLILYNNMPSVNMYIKNFGCFKNALLESGYTSRRILKTKNGVRLNSVYELKLAQVLESYGISYDNEIYYKDVISEFNKKYRFDFEILINNKKYYIEFFGIEGNKKYDERKQEKLEICSAYNIPLIDLYQIDIYSKTNQEIYSNLINRIQLIDNLIA